MDQPPIEQLQPIKVRVKMYRPDASGVEAAPKMMNKLIKQNAQPKDLEAALQQKGQIISLKQESSFAGEKGISEEYMVYSAFIDDYQRLLFILQRCS